MNKKILIILTLMMSPVTVYSITPTTVYNSTNLDVRIEVTYDSTCASAPVFIVSIPPKQKVDVTGKSTISSTNTTTCGTPTIATIKATMTLSDGSEMSVTNSDSGITGKSYITIGSILAPNAGIGSNLTIK